MIRTVRVLSVIFILLCCAGHFTSMAQNMVNNPSFESYTNCPNGFGSVGQVPTTISVNNWFLASPGSSDYFNTCASGQTAVPTNFFGRQMPRTGNGYIGGYWVLQDSFGGREYMQTQLNTPMVAGQQYYISFWVSLAETNKLMNTNALATYQIGAYFGTASVNQWVNQLPLVPQVNNAVGNYITDTAGWKKIEGTYTAAGGESWMIIGNFSPFTSMNYIVYAMPNSPTTLGYGYYYMDDVCVFNMSSAGNVTVHDTAICDQSTSAVLYGKPNMQNYLWDDGTTTINRTITSTGTYWVKSLGECEAWVDTFHVNALGMLQPPQLGNDTSLCFGKSCILNAQSPVYTSYLWNTGETTPQITANTTGRYFVTVGSDCGVFSDSIDIKVKPEVPMPRGLDTTLCTGAGNSIMLPITGHQLLWHLTPGDAGTNKQPPVDASQAGSYAFFLTQTEDGCESNAAVVTVNVLNTPTVTLPEDTALCMGQKITLGKMQDGVNYLWNTGAAECCISVQDNGTYHLRAFNYCGNAEAETEVMFSDCEHCIWTANAFTPNSDGLNDEFVVENLCPISTFQLRIYNRFGQLVFSSNNISKRWDGTYLGKPCDASTYFYYLEAKAEQAQAPKIKIKGDVTLIR